MSNDPDDPSNFFDTPTKPMDLKTCNVFSLPAVDIANQPKGWTCHHCGCSWAMRNQRKVTSHLAKIEGQSIATCQRNLSMPSKEELAVYAYRGSAMMAGRNSQAFKAKVIDNHLSDCHDSLVPAIDEWAGV